MWTMCFDNLFTYLSSMMFVQQGKTVAKLLPTEARLRDVRPKFRNAKKVFKAKQNSSSPQEKKGKVEELQRSFANCLRRSAVNTSKYLVNSNKTVIIMKA